MPAQTPVPAAPVAQRKPQPRRHHGDEFLDPYEWLRDRENPDVVAYLEAENAYTEARTAHLADLRTSIFDEIKARTKETDLSVPVYRAHADDYGRRTAYWYYTRTMQGSEYAIYCRAAAQLVGPGERPVPPDTVGEIAGEQVLLDGNVEADGRQFFSLGAFSVSPDGTLLVYSVDSSGAERFTLRVLDLSSGERLGDVVEDTGYGAVWAGRTHLFYTRADEAWRPYVVRRHRLGTGADRDVDVVVEPDERFWVGVGSSRNDEWIVIEMSSKVTSEVSLLRAAEPESTPRVVAPRRQGVEYSVELAGDRLLIVHNDGAEDFELAQAPLDATGPEQWTPVIAHQAGVRIVGVDAYADHAVVSLRRNGLTGVHLMARNARGDLSAGADLAFDEPIYTVHAAGGSDYATSTVRVHYASMLTPDSTYDCDLTTGALTLLRRRPVLDDPAGRPYRAQDYVQKRAWATASDATMIPLSIVRRADVALDGTAPALIYGYGSYEIPMDPHFSVALLSLLDRGMVYAIAHVRGGGELGRSWYEQGKLLAKRTTFTDFVSCAQHLVDAGYTSPDRLAARGGSAGGLLMGAVANLAPELFCAIHADVPFVDALTTILDPDLPLTVVEWEEWGDPLHDADVYAYMKSYSPYENVAARPYPAILATTSLNDTRVFFVEPAKWVAQLRHTAPDGGAHEADARPILLRSEMVAGHGGVSGRYESWRETAFEYAWIIDRVTQHRQPNGPRP